MHLTYSLNPHLRAEDVAALRIAVGWDAREDKLRKIIGNTYLTGVCYDLDRLVGFVDVISDGVDDALVRNLLVHPDYRGRGIALALLKMIISKTREDNIKTVNVLFEPELTELYYKAGFRIIGGGMIDNEAEELAEK